MRNNHRSGLLKCTTAAGVGTIELLRGMIVNADSPRALELRVHLLANQELTLDQRRVLAALPRDSFADDVIDYELVLGELVPPHVLDHARVARIFSAFREMITWKAGRFSFDPAVSVIEQPIALSVHSILMQLYQEQDEQGQ